MARLFNGAQNEYLGIAKAPVTAPPMTFACCAKFNSLPAIGTYRWLVEICNHNADDSFNLYIINSAGTYALVTNEIDGGINHYAFLVFAPNTTDWFHFAGVFNDTTRECYVNGNGPGTDNGDGGAAAAGLSMTTIAVHIAGGNPTYFFDGAIGEVPIYGAALTSAEIALLAAGCPPSFVRAQSLMPYYPLWNGDDSDWQRGYDMTAYNTPSIAPHPPKVLQFWNRIQQRAVTRQVPRGIVGPGTPNVWNVRAKSPVVLRVPRPPAAYNTLATY